MVESRWLFARRFKRCGGDDAGSAEICSLLIGLGADPDSVQSTLSINQQVEARFEAATSGMVAKLWQ